MDDLIVETFRRSSERELAQLKTAAATDSPLREIWNVCIHTTDARLISEFMALANRIDGLKGEVTNFIEASRAIQVAALSTAMARTPTASRLPPCCLAIIATSIALSLPREDQLGVRSGHSDMMKMIEEFLSIAEPQK